MSHFFQAVYFDALRVNVYMPGSFHQMVDDADSYFKTTRNPDVDLRSQSNYPHGTPLATVRCHQLKCLDVASQKFFCTVWDLLRYV